MKSHVCRLGAAALLATLPLLSYATCNSNIDPSTPDPRFTVNSFTVQDKATGLMWKLCSEGASGANCSMGDAATPTTRVTTGPISLSWQDALARLAVMNVQSTLSGGFGDWRLPNRNELASLLERRCSSPAINANVFPGTPAVSYWTSSPYAFNPSLAWSIDYNSGDIAPTLKTSSHNVRLVRSGN